MFHVPLYPVPFFLFPFPCPLFLVHSIISVSTATLSTPSGQQVDRLPGRRMVGAFPAVTRRVDRGWQYSLLYRTGVLFAPCQPLFSGWLTGWIQGKITCQIGNRRWNWQGFCISIGVKWHPFSTYQLPIWLLPGPILARISFWNQLPFSPPPIIAPAVQPAPGSQVFWLAGGRAVGRRLAGGKDNGCYDNTWYE